MPRHDGSHYKRSRKQLKRRGRNRQSWLDKGAPEGARSTKRSKR
jgi:hypothetical protein